MQPEKLIVEIIKEQSLIIGEDLAKKRAEDTGSIKYNSSKIDDISMIDENPVNAIDNIINAYAELFGKASMEVCFSVIKKYPEQEVGQLLPESLKSQIY